MRGRKLGIMVSVGPDHANFRHGLGLARAALDAGVDVYLYCIDEAIRGVSDKDLQCLQERGLKLFACAFSAQRRNLTLTDNAAYGGLTLLSDVMGATDRFVSFNAA